MNSFSPHVREVFPHDAPDRLTESVVMSLSRHPSGRYSWGAIKTIVLGLFSGGLLPLLVLPLRFRQYISSERVQLKYFAEWFVNECPGGESVKFQETISKLRFRNAFLLGALLMAGLAIAWGWSALAAVAARPIVIVSPLGPSFSLARFEPFTPKFLFQFTARLPHTWHTFASMPRVMMAAEGFAFLLIAAHLICLWQVLLHVSRVRRAVELFNLAASKHGIEPVGLPRAFAGIRAAWILGMIGLAALGAWWGVPMMLAAAAQSRYINHGSRQLRLALAARAFSTAMRNHPDMALSRPESIRAATAMTNGAK